MPQKSAENKFLFISFVLVVLVGVKTVTSLLEPPPLARAALFKERQPASIKSKLAAPASEIVAAKRTGPASFDFSCIKEGDNKEVLVQGALLQIRGKGCFKEGRAQQVSIINKSNGYTASVFPTGHEEFQTDLIQLVEGANEITIQYLTTGGKKIERQVFVKSSHL